MTIKVDKISYTGDKAILDKMKEKFGGKVLKALASEKYGTMIITDVTLKDKFTWYYQPNSLAENMQIRKYYKFLLESEVDNQ